MAHNQKAICQALTNYHRLFEERFYWCKHRHWSTVNLCGQLLVVECKAITAGHCGRKWFSETRRALGGRHQSILWDVGQGGGLPRRRIDMYNSPLGCTFLNSRLYPPEEWFDRSRYMRWQDCGILDDTWFCTEPHWVKKRLWRL